MKITCPSCSATYDVDSSRVPSNGMTMRCPKCSHSFRVSPDGSAGAASGTILDGAGHAGKKERYYVKRPTGKVFGPFDENAVRMMLKSNKLGADADVSTDKESWEPVTNVPAFASVASGDDQKGTMMGGWKGKDDDLPASKEGIDLPAPKQEADLPASKEGIDLPAPKQEADLPASKQGGGPPELPVSKGGADLPASKEGSDLPASAQDNLPASAGGNLPASAEENLPASAGGNLPASAEENLPASAGGNLPASKGGDLPASRDADLPGVQDEEEELFGSSQEEEDLFGSSQEEDEDLFGRADEGDDLFGADDEEEDDLFGADDEEEDDLFGAPVEQEDSLDEDDLFSAEEEEDDDALFEDADHADDDDFLGGDQGFSFLDDGPPEAEAAAEWDDDLFDEESEAGPASEAEEEDWGDDLLDMPAREDKQPVSSEPDDMYDADDPFRPKSRGLSQDAKPLSPASEAATASKEEVVEEDQKRGSMIMIGLPVLLVVVLGGVGYFVYTNLMGDEASGPTEAVEKKSDTDVATSQLKSGNYGDYAAALNAAGANPNNETLGKVLLAESMMLARYPDEKLEKKAAGHAKKLADAQTGFAAIGRGAWEARAGNADAARAYLEPLAGKEGDIGFFAQLLMGVGDVVKLAEERAEEEAQEPAPEPKLEPEGVDETEGEASEGDVAEEEDAEGTDEEEAAEIAEEEAADGDAEEEAAPAEEKPEEDVVEKPTYDGIAARAKNALEAAAKIDPKTPLPPYWLGRLDEVLGYERAAIADFKKASNVAPSHVPSRLELGRIHYKNGDLNKAIAFLEKINGELGDKAAAKERAEAYHLAGLVHVARRQSDMAIENFTRALSVDSSRSDTLRALAEEYERAKKYKEALNFFTTNKNLGQKDPNVMLGIVRSHMGLEQWNQAIRQLEAGQKNFPEDARFPFFLGQLHLRRGSFFDAKKAFERAVEIDPSLLTAQASLAQLAWRMDKDIAKGEEFIEKVVSQPERINAEIATKVAEYYLLSGRVDIAEQWYREALRRNPNHWPARLSLAKEVLLEQGEFVEARKLLERARDEGVQDIRLSAHLADAYRQAEEYDRAIQEINQVIEKFPKKPEYIFIRGRIHFDRGNHETARKDFSRAYDIDPTFHDAYFYVGRTAFAEEDYSTALKIFRHVLDYKPDRGNYHFWMGHTLEELNRTSQALEEYRKATAVDPDYGDENPHVYIKRGNLLSRLGYNSEGKKDIMKALKLAPEMVEALLAMADSDFRDQNYTAAIDHYTKALRREADHPDAQYRLGMALIQKERRRQAAQRLQLAIKHGYDDPEVYKALGYLYKDMGQRSQAVESFKMYLKKTADRDIPDNTKREMLRQIDELGG